MSIVIAGRTYRTLDQPIYLGDGRQVKEVAVNGRIVYPEHVAADTALAKLYGEISMTTSWPRKTRWISGLGITVTRDRNAELSLKASFVAVVEVMRTTGNSIKVANGELFCDRDSRKEYSYQIQFGYPGNMYDSAEFPSGMISWPNYDVLVDALANEAIPLPYGDDKTYSCVGIDTYVRLLEFKARTHVYSASNLCRFSVSTNKASDPPAKYLDSRDYTSSIRYDFYKNDKVLTYVNGGGQQPNSDDFADFTYGGSIWLDYTMNDDMSSKYEEDHGDAAYFFDGFYVPVPYSARATLKSVDTYDSGRPADMNVRDASSALRIQIPTTKVLYIGDPNSAPETMRHAYDSDL